MKKAPPEASFRRGGEFLHIERLHAEDGVTLLSQEVQQLFGIARSAGGLVSNHVGKVLDAVQVLGGLVHLVANLILQILRQPDQTAQTGLRPSGTYGRQCSACRGP